MAMRSNYFRTFRKEESSPKGLAQNNSPRVMSKHPSVSIWNTTDDNNTNSTFDLDEDDLFADRFASSKNNFTSPTPKGNWSDKWTKLMKFDGSSKKNEPGQLSYTSPKLPNLRSVPVNSQRSKFITSPIDLEQPRSPSPTEHTRLQKHAPASPMLDFLNDRSKKTIMQSPDVYNVSTSSEDDVLLNRTVRKSPDYTSAETSCIDNDCEKADNNYNTGDKSPGSVSLSDNFECLYNRLKKEASDLESWKCNTLSQLEGKCRELESYESLVENLRSANVELQINLENMSLKYKEEVELRDNVLERFSSIQSQSSALEERVKKLAEASMTVKSRVFQSEELYDVLRRNYENIKKEFLEHSETCLAKYKEFEDTIESKKCDVEALQQRIIQLGDENKCLEEELILCDRKHQEEIIQLQREIDGLNTDKIELKQIEENIKCSNEEYKSLIKSLESTIEDERAMRINAVKLSETKEKEHEDLVCLLDEHQHKCRLRIQFLDASKQKLNYLCDQVDKSRFHVKSMIDKISNMIKSLSTFQEKQHHRNEDIFHTLTVVKGKVVELKKVLNNRSLIMHDFESNIYNICADLVMENHLLCIDRENSVILRRKVTELEKDTECMYKRQDNMRAALEKCQIFNEKLQLDNDELHSKLTSEKQKYAEVHGNLLKSEALVKLLEEQTKMIEEEVKEMRTKFSEVKKELEEKRANCSKLKEKMEACEIRYNELKLTDEENRKALNLAHSEIKGREEQQEELKSQLTLLNQEKQEHILKEMQLSNNINNLTMQLEYSQQEVGQQKLREKSIQEQNQRLETMKNQLQKQTDDLTNEILSLKEKLNQKDLELKQKQDDIDSLKKTIDVNTMESSEGNKELVKKLNESLNLIDQIGEQTMQVNRNKMEILKKQAIREEEIKKLKAKTADQERELTESHDENERLRGEMGKMKEKDAKQKRILAENNRELVKLRAIEREYREFQHQIYSNSPPISTQLPGVIPAKVTPAPGSPASSLELDGLGMNEITATTPNSILRQPGAGIKRRRVSFAPVKYEAPDTTIQADRGASDDTDEEYALTPTGETSPSFMNPSGNSELQTLEQVENIRRTPRRHGHEINQDNYSLRRRNR